MFTLAAKVRRKWGVGARIENHNGYYRIVVGLNNIVLGEGFTPEEAYEDACHK